jgi:hypothetical protein
MRLSISIPEGSDFTLQNLPWGSMVLANGQQHLCIAIGEDLLDMNTWSKTLKDTEWSIDVISSLQQVRFSRMNAKQGCIVHTYLATHVHSLCYIISVASS